MRSITTMLRDKSCFFGIRDFVWDVVGKVSDLNDRHTGTARLSSVEGSR